jgi:preprotein translocase subunit SecG
MTTVILVIHVMLAIALVATILLQRSEGGALGIGGGGMGGFMTGRATANLLSRTTAVIAACFFLTSLLLAYLGGLERKPTSIIEQPSGTAQPAPPTAAPGPAPSAPEEKPAQESPKEPEVPVAR